MVAYRNGGMRMWHVESVAVAREYACSENGEQREAAAGSLLTPATYLGRLIHDRVSYVRKAALSNRKRLCVTWSLTRPLCLLAKWVGRCLMLRLVARRCHRGS